MEIKFKKDYLQPYEKGKAKNIITFEKYANISKISNKKTFTWNK